MQASYGYSDGTGDYFITIDTDRCDGCALCVGACPEAIFEVAPDDYGKVVGKVKDGVLHRISYVCPGSSTCSRAAPQNCQAVCGPSAISHTW